MSTAARKLDTLPKTTPRVRPSRTAAARPPGITPPHPHRRARRGSPLAFWILVFVMAAFVIVGIASLSALLVQSSFQVDELRSHLGALQQQEEALRQQVAERSSPKRVAEWAHEHGMENPQQVVILPISGGPVREEAE